MMTPIDLDGLAWTIAWQSTLLLGAGLIAGAALRRRPARAHAVLLAFIVGAGAAPLLTGVARANGLGVLGERAAAPTGPVATDPVAEEPVRLAASDLGAGQLGEGRLREAPLLPGGHGRDSLAGRGFAPGLTAREALAGDWAGVARTVLVAAWAAMSGLMLTRLIVGAVRGRGVLQRAIPAGAPLEDLARAIAARVGARAAPEVLISAELGTPAVWCWSRRARVILPSGWRDLDLDLDGILAHELAHWVRRDHLGGMAVAVLAVFVPWHPLVWTARRRLRAFAEQSCDTWALRAGGEPARYARSLLAFIPVRGPTAVLAAVTDRRSLMARIQRIQQVQRDMGEGSAVEPRAGAAFLGVCAVLAALVTAAAALAQARPPAPTQPDRAPAAQPGKDYAARLAALGESNWRVANALGQEIASLPPERGWAVMRENWAAIASVEARQQMIKAWFFGNTYPLRPRAHPHTLDVMDLGMRDASPKVQAWAIGYLKGVAFEDFALDFGAYEAWHAKSKGRATAEVATDSCLAWIQKLKAMQTDTDFAAQGAFIDKMGQPFRDQPEVTRAAIDAGIVEILEPWIQRGAAGDGAVRKPAAEVIGLFGQMSLDRPRLERVVVPLLAPGVPGELRSPAAGALGKPENGWAFPVLLGALREAAAAADLSRSNLWDVARALAELGDAGAIPTMIAVIDSENGYDTVYGVGYFGLTPLTGVDYNEAHDGAWWRAWWDKNKPRFPEAVRNQSIPELPKRTPARGPAAGEAEDPTADVADIPFQDLRAEGDENKRYVLIGPKPGVAAPAAGYRLVLVLPGGDGGEDFRPFVQRILKNALADDCVVAELVAPRWSDNEDRIVWPTTGLKDPGMKFPTEDFVASVVRDAAARLRIDPKRVDALGWSSGGPPVYAAAVGGGSPLRGALVAMSVFKPELMPPLDGAAGKRFYILHSPEDFIQMRFPEAARDRLSGAGAATTLVTYEGGHGWHGDAFGMIKAGLDWLDGAGR